MAVGKPTRKKASEELERGGQPEKRRPGRPRLLEPSADYLARKADILAAAARVFHEKGYDAGTLDDVADALDLRRASLYYYVQSKANLLYMLFEHAIDLGVSEFESLKEVQDPVDRLIALVRFHIRFAGRNRELASVVYDERNRLEPQHREQHEQREEMYFNACLEAVVGAKVAGVSKREDALYLTHAIVGMAAWCYKWFEPGRDDAERFADVCVSLILGSLPRRSKLPVKSANSRRGR